MVSSQGERDGTPPASPLRAQEPWEAGYQVAKGAGALSGHRRSKVTERAPAGSSTHDKR